MTGITSNRYRFLLAHYILEIENVHVNCVLIFVSFDFGQIHNEVISENEFDDMCEISHLFIEEEHRKTKHVK